MDHTNSAAASEVTHEDPRYVGPPMEGAATIVVQSRFGPLEIDPAKAVLFENGLFGFSDCRRFALTELNSPGYPHLKVLQCLDDTEVAFLVLPLGPTNALIERPDIVAACDSIGMAEDDLGILVMVTIRATEKGPSISANLCAPLLIDTASRLGIQYVLSSEKYPIRYPL